MKASSLGILILTSILYCIPVGSQEPMSMEQIAEPIMISEPAALQEQFIEQIDMSLQEEVIEAMPLNKWRIKLTDDEIDMLAQIAFLEAHTQSEDGVLAVIEIIFNRMISDSFPNTLEEVLSQSEPCTQFTTWKKIDFAKPTQKEYDMIYAALNGEKEVLTTEYVYFGRGKQNDNDPIKIEDHWFCKE